MLSGQGLSSASVRSGCGLVLSSGIMNSLLRRVQNTESVECAEQLGRRELPLLFNLGGN